MKKKFQVFISSTYTDLIEERQRAVTAVLDSNHIPAGMELFKANNQDQMKVIRQWIDESDVFLLILGGRYGSLDPASQKSYTHLEYEYALEKKMPIFTLILTDKMIKDKFNQFDRPMDDFREVINIEKHAAFVEQTKTGSIVRYLDSIYQIDGAVMGSLINFEKDSNIDGWVRSNEPSADNLSLMRQIEELKGTIATLKYEARVLMEENHILNRSSNPEKESILKESNIKFSSMMDVASLTMVSARELAPYTGLSVSFTDMLSVLKIAQVQEEIFSGITNRESPDDVLRYYISQNLIGFLSSNHLVNSIMTTHSNGSVSLVYRVTGQGLKFFIALNQEKDKL
ncbi:DUF4062 domain-containing protein [Exiguobacterium sp. RIT594]|uniref:DUF4062 domain-containing protein n=1 Tax=Exiguobacterium sp. RIT594 TaxID=2282449 RepID=UPI000DF84862|nr:DUF4062 domain-containing protein [Exiguobacterium sp. RIT594]RDB32056.1 DUF4062 domain-containing protein [Exiguobacterium sp. RIT594]